MTTRARTHPPPPTHARVLAGTGTQTGTDTQAHTGMHSHTRQGHVVVGLMVIMYFFAVLRAGLHPRRAMACEFLNKHFRSVRCKINLIQIP